MRPQTAGEKSGSNGFCGRLYPKLLGVTRIEHKHCHVDTVLLSSSDMRYHASTGQVCSSLPNGPEQAVSALQKLKGSVRPT